jgi:LEA14-like dessication related protein
MKWKALSFCLLILGSSLIGCSGLFRTIEPPRINIVNVTPKDIKLFEQIFDLELRVQNPNEAALPIHGLAFELEINDRRFATGVSNENVTVDGFSSQVIHVQAVTSSWGILQQIAQLQRTGTPLATYRIKGAIYSGSPSVKLPFDDSGELKMPVGPAK